MPPTLITRAALKNMANKSNLTKIEQQFIEKDSNSTGFISYHDYMEVLKNYYDYLDFTRITHYSMFTRILNSVYKKGDPIEYGKFITFMRKQQTPQEQPKPPLEPSTNTFFVSHNDTSMGAIKERERVANELRQEHNKKTAANKAATNKEAANRATNTGTATNRRKQFLQKVKSNQYNKFLIHTNRHNTQGGSKKVRKHQGIYQRGPNKGKLKPGFKYSGKKTKTGLKVIVKVSK